MDEERRLKIEDFGRPTTVFGRPIGRPNLASRAPETLWRFLGIFGRPTERPNSCAVLFIYAFCLVLGGNLDFLLLFLVYLSGLSPKHELAIDLINEKPLGAFLFFSLSHGDAFSSSLILFSSDCFLCPSNLLPGKSIPSNLFVSNPTIPKF